MSRQRIRFHAEELTVFPMLLRLLCACFAVGACVLVSVQTPFYEPGFADGVSLPLVLLGIVGATALQGAVCAFFPSAMRERGVLLAVSVIFFAIALFKTERVWLYAVCCALQLAVCAFCFTGKNRLRLPFRFASGVIAGYVFFGILFTVFVGGLTALRYKMYAAPCFDFGIFAQMFESMAKTGRTLTTCERDVLMPHLHVHLSFIYYLLLPFYLVFRTPMFLNVAQAVILASGLIPLYLLCRKRGLSDAATLAMGAVYTFYPALGAGCFYDIHENCFLTPLLLWLFAALDADRTVGAVAAVVAICAVKEDAPIYVLFVCVWMMFEKKKFLKPFLLALTALVWFGASVFYLNAFGDGAMMYRYANFSTEGGSVADVLRTVAVNPGYVFLQCFDSEKLSYFLTMMLPLGFLPLLTKRMHNYILLGPFMLVNLMSYYPYQHALDFQYNFGSAALLLFLTADNLSRLKPDARRLAAALCACLALFGSSAYLGGKTGYIDYYRSIEPTCARLDAVVDMVPDGASVSACTFILPHLADHDELYQINGASYDLTGRTEYVVIDLRYEEFAALYPQYLAAGYQPLAYDDGVAALLYCPFYKNP